MRITKITIPNELTSEKGIREISEERLGSVVALVGKNGSGKTRILDLLEENIRKIISVNRFLDKSILYPPQVLVPVLNQLEEFKEYILLTEKKEIIETIIKKSPTEKNKQELDEITKAIKEERGKLIRSINRPASTNSPNRFLKLEPLLKEANEKIERVYTNFIKRINYSELRELQAAIDSGSDSISTFEDLIESIAENIDYNELSSIHKSSLKFLKKLPNQLVTDFIKSVPDTKKIESKTSHKRFMALKKSFESFLGKTLEWEARILESNENDEGQVESKQIGVWLINGREFNYKEFSEGEKTLFAYSLIFFLIGQNPALRIKDSIILIDEPELHLHADSEIDLITSLRLAVGEKGQLWIATHSINILSNLDYAEIFMVKDGKLNHPSSTIQRETLSQLMSLEDRVNKLSTFLISITDWTILNFVTDCFSNPEVVEFARKDDPQVAIFKTAIQNLTVANNNLLLDFGAGKGRLFEQVIDDTEFRSKISYSALEPEVEFHPMLKKLGAKKIYSSHLEIPPNTYNFIVLCNVLHEIDIKSWVETLNMIIKGLTEDGFLLIIEAKILSKGEMIGEIGYLVLDIEELKGLFGLSEINFMTEKTNSNDIICAMLPKTNLKEIDNSNVLKSMRLLEENTLQKLEILRKTEVTVANQAKLGRQTAFFSQLYINSKFAQKYLESL